MITQHPPYLCESMNLIIVEVTTTTEAELDRVQGNFLRHGWKVHLRGQVAGTTQPAGVYSRDPAAVPAHLLVNLRRVP